MSLRLGILLSGRGSNMQAIVGAIERGELDAEVALVFSNRPDAPGLAWARAQGLPTDTLSHRGFPSREAFDAEVIERLRAADAEWIALAGFMRILSRRFVDAYRDRILNIHPALLPSFPGLDTHERALAAGVRLHGCTVHLVTEELDGGPIVAQAAVGVRDDDTPERLAARVLRQEHVIYPRVLALASQGRLQLRDGRVRIDAVSPGETPALVWP